MNIYEQMLHAAAYAPDKGGNGGDIEDEIDTGIEDEEDPGGEEDEVEDDGADNLTRKSDIDKQLEKQIDKDFGNATPKAKKDAKDGDKGKGQQPPAREGTRTGGADHRGDKYLQQFARTHLSQDKVGNLIDPATGAVVAAAGRERFYFEQARQARHQGNKLVQRLTQAVELGKQFETELNTRKEIDRTGLSAEDQLQAVKLFNSYKTNPTATLKYILTEAQANGTDLSTVLGSDARGLDMGSIKTLITNELKPLIEPMKAQRDRQEQIRQLEAEADRQTREFFETFPDAVPHERVLAQMMVESNAKPELVYVRLKEWAQKNGLDWSRDLGQQMAALKKNGGDDSRRPLPQGRQQRQIESDNSDKDASFGANARTDDIVRQAMREAGMNID
jgi:hypothetical protein